MCQDMEARSFSEVELFLGEILKLVKKYNVPTSVNKGLYERIKLVEGQY